MMYAPQPPGPAPVITQRWGLQAHTPPVGARPGNTSYHRFCSMPWLMPHKRHILSQFISSLMAVMIIISQDLRLRWEYHIYCSSLQIMKMSCE